MRWKRSSVKHGAEGIANRFTDWRLSKRAGPKGFVPSLRTDLANGFRCRTASRGLRCLAVAATKPSIVGPVIHDFDHNDVPLAAIAHDRVEEPPEGGQVLHEQVLQSVPVLQGLRDPVSFHDLAMKAVRQENWL